MWWDVFHLMENILYSPLCFTEIFSSQPIKIFVSWKKRSKGTFNHIRQLIFQFIVKIHTIFHLAIKQGLRFLLPQLYVTVNLLCYFLSYHIRNILFHFRMSQIKSTKPYQHFKFMCKVVLCNIAQSIPTLFRSRNLPLDPPSQV